MQVPELQRLGDRGYRSVSVTADQFPTVHLDTSHSTDPRSMWIIQAACHLRATKTFHVLSTPPWREFETDKPVTFISVKEIGFSSDLPLTAYSSPIINPLQTLIPLNISLFWWEGSPVNSFLCIFSFCVALLFPHPTPPPKRILPMS